MRQYEDIMKIQTLAGMSAVVAIVLASNTAHAMGATRKEQEQMRSFLVKSRADFKEKLEKAKAEEKAAREKVSPARLSKAIAEKQKAASELGAKSVERALDQATKPQDDTTSVKNTLATIKDLKVYEKKAGAVTAAFLDYVGVTDAQRAAAESSERVRALEKELKATEKGLRYLERAITESAAKERAVKEKSRKENKAQPSGYDHNFEHHEPHQIERDIIGGRDNSRVA
jgi:hypothetical protein